MQTAALGTFTKAQNPVAVNTHTHLTEHPENHCSSGTDDQLQKQDESRAHKLAVKVLLGIIYLNLQPEQFLFHLQRNTS